MSSSSPSVAFIICTEKGVLEKKSVLFAESLRKYGGSLKNAPIYSICPRKGYSIANTTLAALKNLSVTHIEKEVNSFYSDYIFANKIEACVYFENRLKEEILVFCDSDQLVLGDLNEFILKKVEDVAMQQVAIKGIGTDGKDENTDYWNRLYEITGVEKRRYIQLDSGEKIFEYYNAGLIVAKRNAGLFGQWKKNFELVMNQNLLPQHGLFFVEQSVLSATIQSMKLNVKLLPKEFNIHFLKNTKAANILRKVAKNEISMLHYHHAFDQGKSHLIPKGIHLKDSEKLNWLDQKLKLIGLNNKALLNEIEYAFEKNKNKLAQLLKNK